MNSRVADEIQKFVAKIPNIKEGRNYWFVRTQGGDLYEPFIDENLIAIKYSPIKLDEIEMQRDLEPPKRLRTLQKIIKGRDPDASRPGQIASTLSRFCFEIQEGDVVIIPSTSSAVLTFGIVQDSKAAVGTINESSDLRGHHTRAVKWIKSIARDKLNGKLYRLFFCHQTIVNGNEYSELIDSTINDFYVKDRKLYLQIHIQKESEILAKDLFTACLDLLSLTDEFLKQHGIDQDTENTEVKVSVSSPGEVEFISTCIQAMAVLGFIAVILAGGEINSKILGNDISMKTPGLLKSLSDFLNSHKKRKHLGDIISKLDVKNPEDAIKVLKQLNE